MSDLLRGALGPGPECPPLETLAGMLAAKPPAELARHVAACPHCRTEVHLLRTFEAAEVNSADQAAVRQITERLRTRSGEIRPRPEPWWSGLFVAPWLRPAALAFAAILLVTGITLQLHHAGPPALRTSDNSAPDVMRSHTVTVVAPSGDIEKTPSQVQWQGVAGAAKYQVRVLEVDGTELWEGETADTHIDLPANLQARIVPAKSLLCEVHALDASGRVVAESNAVHFRVLQKLYPR